MRKRDKQHPKSASSGNANYQRSSERHTAVPKDELSNDSLKEFADDYLAILENSLSGTVIVEASTGKILYANRAALNFFGYNSMEELGEANLMDYAHPDDRDRAFLTFVGDLNSSSKHDKSEFRMITRYGEEKPVITLSMPIRYQNKLAGLISLVDITERRGAEEAFRDSGENLREMFESMAEAVTITDLEGRIVDANPAAVKLHGYGNKQEIIGMKASDIVAESDRERAVKDSINILKTGKAKLAEYKVTVKGGASIDGEFYTTVMRDYSGNPTGFIGILRDISERKRIGEELRESEQKLRTVVSSITDGLIITDMMGIITDVNEAALRIGNRESMGDWKGRDGRDFVEESDRERLTKIVISTIKDPERLHSDFFEYTAKDKDGTPFYGESSVAVMRDSSGKPTGIVFVTRDISERKRLEDKLRESELKLRTVVGSITDGLIITDMTGMITDANEAAVRIGKRESVEEWHGRNGLDFVEESDRKRIAKIVISTIKDPERLHSDFFEYTAKNKDGTPFYGESSIAVMRDSSGKPTGIVFVTRDISERKRLERDLRKALDDLQRSNKDLEQFVYVASHDMQEPLRMISSYTQLLGKRYKGKLDSDADEFIGFAVDGASRMQKMINDLLIFSRVTTRGKDFEPVDLEKVLSDAIDNLKIAIEENKATIIHDPLPKVMADEPQMVRLLQNIIGNAIKFHGQEPPIIHVGAKEEMEEWAISVKDNGIGIDKKFFDHLFIVFQRLHTRDQYPGTGIGLAVCKKTVERHGGRIWVESEGEGKGSAFTFTLPKRALNKKVEPAKSLQENDQENDHEKEEDKK